MRIDSASDNTVGGTVAAARNLISGNNVGVLIVGAGAIGNTVLGNYIGTDATGLLVSGQFPGGGRDRGSAGQYHRRNFAGRTNVISGNQWGVTITDLHCHRQRGAGELDRDRGRWSDTAGQ